jgi:hypothetical protein
MSLVRLGIEDGEGDAVALPPAQLVDAVQVKVRIEQNGSLGDLRSLVAEKHRRLDHGGEYWIKNGRRIVHGRSNPTRQHR